MPRRRRFRPNYPLWLAVFVFVGAIAAYIGLGVLVSWLTPRRPGMPDTLYLAFVARCLDATLAVWFFSVGASIGSFLNVVAYRLPLGRTLGGHSACPFCTTQIASSDNIPVLAWLRLRGRCRTCRLPISIQYPLVELAVGLIFLAMYFLEFGVAGTNLPGSGTRQGIGLIWMSVTRTLAVRVLLAVYLLSGLIAAALIVIRGARVPLALTLWLALVLVVTPLALPETIVIPWSGVPASKSLSVIDAGITLAIGMSAGLIVGALTLPLVCRAGNSPESADQMEGVAWLGAMVCLGLLIGWQALPLAVAWILLTTLLARWVLRRWSPWKEVSRARQPIVWAWLGFVLFRATWKIGYGALHGLGQLPAWSVDMLPLLAVFSFGLVSPVQANARKLTGKISQMSHVVTALPYGKVLVMLQCGGTAQQIRVPLLHTFEHRCRDWYTHLFRILMAFLLVGSQRVLCGR